MGEDSAPAAEAPREPTWGEKVIRLSSELTAQGVPFAFGGAIALNYHRDPRSTVDIDINIFLAPEDHDTVVSALDRLYALSDSGAIDARLSERGQTRTQWGRTHVDLFFANTDFHASMAQRVVYEQFDDTAIPVLSIEDLLVCKALFNRPKDWIDIEAVAANKHDNIDRPYIEHWLGQFLSYDDPRLSRLRDALEPKL